MALKPSNETDVDGFQPFREFKLYHSLTVRFHSVGAFQLDRRGRSPGLSEFKSSDSLTVSSNNVEAFQFDRRGRIAITRHFLAQIETSENVEHKVFDI